MFLTFTSIFLVTVGKVDYLNKGEKGVFIMRQVKKGEFLTRYLYTKQKNNSYQIQLRDGTFVWSKDCIAVYVNHSCSPNSVLEENQKKELWLRAKTDLSPGTEVVYSYSGGRKKELYFECRCKTCSKARCKT